MLTGAGVMWGQTDGQTVGTADGSQHLWAGGPRVVKICHYFEKSQTSRFYVTVSLSIKHLFNLKSTVRFFLSFMPDS